MVNLGADIAAALPELRRQAESRMTETLRFFTTTRIVDEDTLETVEVEVVAGTSRGRIKYSNTVGSEDEPGGQAVVVTRREVHVPVGSVDAAVGTLVRVLDSDVDDSLVGRVFRIAEPHAAGQVTKWRYPATEVTNG